MCTVILPPDGNPIAVKYIASCMCIMDTVHLVGIKMVSDIPTGVCQCFVQPLKENCIVVFQSGNDHFLPNLCPILIHLD
jgi:hypothetical protein